MFRSIFRQISMLVFLIVLSLVPTFAQKAPVEDPEQVRHLAFLEWESGVWDADISLLDPSSGEMQKFRGEQTDRMGACGLWLITDLKLLPNDSGELPSPYEGHGVLGYDPARKKLVGLWVDPRTDWLATAEGHIDSDGKTLILDVESRHPATGDPMPQRFVTRKIDANRKEMDTLIPGPNGEFIKISSISYRRRGSSR